MYSRFNCSKKESSEPTFPPGFLFEVPIDLDFHGFIPTYSRSYYITDSSDTITETVLYAIGFGGRLPGDTLSLIMEVHQTSFNNDSTDSTNSIPTFTISREGADDYFSMQPDSIGFNFFNLTYQYDFANFSGKCHVTEGTGKFVKITEKTAPLTFSGFMDTI